MTKRNWLTVLEVEKAYPYLSAKWLGKLIWQRETNGMGVCLKREGPLWYIDTIALEQWLDCRRDYRHGEQDYDEDDDQIYTLYCKEE